MPLILLLITPLATLIMPQAMIIMPPVTMIMLPTMTSESYSGSEYDNAPEKTTKMVGGRPKDSTDAAAEDLERRVEAATKEAVKCLKIRKQESRSSKKRLRYGLLNDIIEASKKKYCIPDDVIISKECMQQRVKRNSKDNHAGQTSPMIDIEPYLVELIIKLVNMCTPITTSQGLELANSLISGTSTEEQLIAWKKKNCAAFE